MKPTFFVTLSFEADSSEEFEERLDDLTDMAKQIIATGKDLAPLGPWSAGINDGWVKIEVLL